MDETGVQEGAIVTDQIIGPRKPGRRFNLQDLARRIKVHVTEVHSSSEFKWKGRRIIKCEERDVVLFYASFANSTAR